MRTQISAAIAKSVIHSNFDASIVANASRGVAAGREYPVFDTPIGKIGMMICFDVRMPEVARGLAANGAEIIAMPIMDGHPALAKARAVENQVVLVASSYSINDNWMQTGVWDLDGELLVRTAENDTVVVAEVDLNKQHIWRANMGELKSRLRHERPSVPLPRQGSSLHVR